MQALETIQQQRKIGLLRPFFPLESLARTLLSSQLNEKEKETTAMQKRPKILITDRNKRIRDLLKREMNKAGLSVDCSKTEQDAAAAIGKTDSPDLLVLDPDILSGEGSVLIEKLKDLFASLPVILHAFSGEDVFLPGDLKISAVVGKGENSVEELVSKIKLVLSLCEHSKEGR